MRFERSYFPELLTQTTKLPLDGVVLDTIAFPGNSGATGIVGVHEVGHWFGLFHSKPVLFSGP